MFTAGTTLSDQDRRMVQAAILLAGYDSRQKFCDDHEELKYSTLSKQVAGHRPLSPEMAERLSELVEEEVLNAYKHFVR